MNTPKEITHDKEYNRHVASFDYYTGLRVAKEKGLLQSTLLSDNTFIVCCGDVMIKVTENDYPEIKRRII